MEVEIKVPEFGESILEATISKWLKNQGDEVAQDEPIAELETEKVSVEVNSPEEGILSKISHSEGDTVKVGELLAVVSVGAKSKSLAKAKKGKATQSIETAVPKPDQVENPMKETLPPSVRRIIAENSIQPSEIKGTGKHGQITKADAQFFVDQSKDTRLPDTILPGKSIGEPNEEETITPMSPLRKTISRRLVESQHTTATLTTFNEIDMQEVMDLKTQYKDIFLKRHEIKLGFMSFFVKASVHALKMFPKINAEIRGDDIVYKHHYDIGVAVGGPKGLVVPVVRNADQLSLSQIEQNINLLAQKVRDVTIGIKDLEGGTFTISNGGIYGSMLSTPILNPPQVGILGMHNIVERAVVIQKEIKIRPIMYVAFSYDHRMVDGKEAVQFLVKIKEILEDPIRLLLDC